RLPRIPHAFSEYGRWAGSDDLRRSLEPYNFDAFGRKGHAGGDVEPFLAVTYMDLHVLDPACGIGLHRHRDNQEVFLMLEGDALMVVGDWADSAAGCAPSRYGGCPPTISPSSRAATCTD
ncbi:hypothetical protein DF18_36065, partial [Streptomyces rimosus]|uniref:cupin domain-containing protein n=1 Tax=Streptomyces rimosus TaxID=1927 RepID=UPI0004DA3D6C